MREAFHSIKISGIQHHDIPSDKILAQRLAIRAAVPESIKPEYHHLLKSSSLPLFKSRIPRTDLTEALNQLSKIASEIKFTGIKKDSVERKIQEFKTIVLQTEAKPECMSTNLKLQGLQMDLKMIALEIVVTWEDSAASFDEAQQTSTKLDRELSKINKELAKRIGTMNQSESQEAKQAVEDLNNYLKEIGIKNIRKLDLNKVGLFYSQTKMHWVQ